MNTSESAGLPGSKALQGRRILVTRSREQAPALQNALSLLGAEALNVPLIQIVPPPSYDELDHAIASLAEFDYLVLTSVNAVRAFLGRLNEKGLGGKALNGLVTVAVGPKSAEALVAEGVNADLTPEAFRAEGIVALLQDKVKGKRVLYPKAALARDLIPSSLKKFGAEVIAPIAYASAIPPEASAKLKKALENGLDLLTFTASSTVINFVKILEPPALERAKKIPVASIGPLTSKTAQQLGFNVMIEPQRSTLEDLVEAIKVFFSEPNAAVAHKVPI